MEKTILPISKGNTLELHYWFNDQSHSMDALIQNKCEYEFLYIIKEISKIYEYEIIIETEPFAEGGIRRWFKIISKKENKNATITTGLITAFATLVLITPLGQTLGEISKTLINKIFEDKELIELQKEKIKEEIEGTRLDNKIKKQSIDKSEEIFSNNKINKRKSNFYEALESSPKIEKISVTLENEEKESLCDSVFINKSQFNNYIYASDELDPIYVEDATIEIISPVLKKGNYRWRGIYNGEIISFSMRSNEFKTLVQTGKIEFKNGSSIKCHLEIQHKFDSNGEEQIIGYNILRVNEYFENDKPVETPEGKKYRQKREAEKQQLNFFDDMN